MLNDSDVVRYFAPESIKEAYCSYKECKTDRFNGKVKISTGADGVTWEEFEADLERNAVNISRRILDCSYTFYPLLQYAIYKETKRRVPVKGINHSTNLCDHKPPEKTRILSVARIRDVLVQKQLYAALNNDVERIFSATPALDHVSYAYRVDKSVQLAAKRVKEDVLQKGYRFAFEADIKSFFDEVDHKRLIHLINEWVGDRTICGRLLRKYVLIDVIPWDSYRAKPSIGNHDLLVCHTKKGIPQGGVISGMLANLYLHEFDCWVLAELATQYDIRYYRYADDFVILTRNRDDAAHMKGPVSAKLGTLDLKLHDSIEKTGVRDIDQDGLCP